MSSPPREDADRRTLLKRAYAAIDEQQARIRDLEGRLGSAPPQGPDPHTRGDSRLREPLAIVGLSCRFPGADGPDEYWHLLRSGLDAITEVPADRWNVEEFYDPDPDAPGRMYTRHGGFLQDVAAFDADFFGISPREAVAMDPQQRLLLETTWEALDRAGQPRDRLAGSATGVFIGITANEYAPHAHTPEGLSSIDAYHITGNTSNAAAGRIAYTLGFRGPAVAIDTACSSSLVAVHLACSAIRQGDCEQAIAGGVHLILSPAGHVALCKARVLAPSGRCRTFDAGADGMARGEGCGVIVIRRLSDAIRDGDPIVAVIRGSAVNQDGPSSGLTVPNGPAQEDVIRRALANAGVEPRQVSYIEAHGTATPLGDPIEVKALGGALCEGRTAETPLLVGSVKTNIGHLEAAAGIAGLIKLALALEHGEIPPHLHFETPSPQIPWSGMPVEVVTRLRPWTRSRTPRVAGVSAFGFSGTNAHVVLEEAPVRAPAHESTDGHRAHLLRVAARSETALRALAGRYAAHVAAHTEQRLEDVCATANTGRADGVERGAVVARDRAGLVAGLAKLARGEAGPGLARGRAVDRRRVGVLFTGRCGGTSATVRTLYETEPAFAQVVDRCAAAVRDVLDADVRDAVCGAAVSSDTSPECARVGLFAVACGLEAVWRAWGITPWGVTGREVGEYAAAVAAGLLELETAARLVAQSAQPFEMAASAAVVTLAPPQVRLASTAEHLRAHGCDVLLEIGGATTRGELLENAATLYVAGVRIDWTAVDRAADRRRVVLPTYPWQRRRFWRERPAPPAVEPPDPCAGWTYEVAWQEKGREIARLVEPHLEQLRADPATARYAGALDELERRAVLHVAGALTRMGLDARTQPPFAADGLAGQLGVVPSQRPLFARMLGMLEEAGALERAGQQWRCVTERWPELSRPVYGGLTPYPEADAERRVLDRCGLALPEVLRGAQDGLALLFPSDGSPSAAHLYSDSPAARMMNGIVEQVFGGLIDERSPSALRILEVGAGTGGTTASILPRLAERAPASTYTFTDVSPAFLAQARARFAEFPFLQTARLDVETSPIEQGFAAGAYDVVLAANVLHATRDLGRSLDHAMQLLAPGGVLVLQEWTGALGTIDVIFGLTDGWWRFDDRERRPSHPLLSADRWRALLAERGFERVEVLGSSPRDRGALAKQAVVISRAPLVRGRWVVVSDRAGVGERVRAALAARGKAATLVTADSNGLRASLGSAAGSVPLAGVVDLRALDAPAAGALSSEGLEQAAEHACRDLLQLVQSIVRDTSGPCQLDIVTRGAVSIEGESCDGVAQSPLWGVGKVVSLEHPEVRARLIDLDAVGDPAHAVADASERHPEETQLACRGGRTWVPRLLPHRPAHARRAIRFDAAAAYVVTGGFGGLGLLLAEWLAARGAGLVVLAGRRGPTADASEAIRRVEQCGGRIMARRADVADLNQITGMLDAVRATGTRVAGVFHAAGILDDGILLQLEGERFAGAMRPKVQGAWNLHTATRDDRLDHFVLFSAATSMFGSAGQATHAAANAFLDACAAHRKAAGLPALSVNWGAWSRVGAASGAAVAARVRMKGLRPIEPAQGLEILERLMQGDTAQVGVFGVDWDAIPSAMAALPFLAACRPRTASVEVEPMATPASATGAAALAATLETTAAHRRRPLVAAHVRDEVRRILALGDSAPLDMRQGFFDLGFDSLTSMELRNRLQSTCGCSLPATLVFDYPTPEALVDRLMALMSPEPAAPAAAGAGAGQGEVADLLTRKLAELRESLGS